MGEEAGCPVAVFVYRWERAPGLWTIMASLEPCYLQNRPRGMVSVLRRKRSLAWTLPKDRG